MMTRPLFHGSVLAGVAALHLVALFGLSAWARQTPPLATPQVLSMTLVAQSDEAPAAAPRPAPPRPRAEPPRPMPKATPAPTPRPPVTAAPSPRAVSRPEPAREAPTAAPAAPASPTPAPVADAAPRAAAPSKPQYNAGYLNNPKPAYPALSRDLGEEGTVRLLVEVSARGEATAVSVAASSGYPRLDRAAQGAVRQWRFVPAKRGDEAVADSVIVPIHFSLRTEAS